MYLKELYYLYFVFLRTLLGFEFLQKSFSQSCHKFLINPPYSSIGDFYLLCHCHTHYRQSERKKISRAQCRLNILSYLSLPGIRELLWCFPQGKPSMKHSVTVQEQSHGFHPLSPWVNSLPGFLMNDVASGPGGSLCLILPTCFGWCSQHVSMGCLPKLGAGTQPVTFLSF